jgi:hypothetical protein
MKIRALVVSDVTETRNNKEGKPVVYRTLAVVDQDEAGPSLESMAKLAIPHDEPKAAGNLSGSVITARIRAISDDWRGLAFRGDLASVDGSMTFTPAGGKGK